MWFTCNIVTSCRFFIIVSKNCLLQPAGRVILFILFFGIAAGALNAQEVKLPDTLDLKKLRFTQNKFVNNIFQQAVNSVTRTPEANADESYLNGKSEDSYLPYQGRIIRHIFIEPYGFNWSFYDTSARDNSRAAKIGSKLHHTTRRFVIRNNLFIEENTRLNAFMLADNERHIRSLEFIQDARILVNEVPGTSDSVDVTVYTKDLFSIGGGGGSNGLNHISINLYDANFVGMGQRVEISGLYDYNRSPNFGYGALYRKTNIGHSFIDGTAGYTVMNMSDYTLEEEATEYVSLSRRLVSPYSRFAGGLTISHNESHNAYNTPDSNLLEYKYNLFDLWAGYNLGIRKLTDDINSKRDRKFLALRYYNRFFTDIPFQVNNRFNPVFNSSQALLAQITLFRQDYYKTQYIYGFGTTEDLPYGYKVAVTAGWHKQLSMERPYAGLNVTKYIATPKGDFIEAYLRTGGFLYNSKIQDGGLLFGAILFSRIHFWNSTKIRQYINASYTQLYNRVTTAPLAINNFYGLRGFLSDSAVGGQRISLQLETEFFLHFKILGFQFAPFPYIDMSLLTPEHGSFSKSSFYTSVGGGVRARNEHLIFETIELRAYFFPVAPQDMSGFKVILNANIRYRYSSNFIAAPDLVQLNNY